MAIVGINGAGKTTLLKIIMQEEEADSGQIVLSKDRTIGYLSQHQDIFYDDTVYGVMEDAMKPVIELQDKIRKLEQDMTTLTGDELKAALSTYNRYTHEFEYKNGYAYESEITGVLKVSASPKKISTVIPIPYRADKNPSFTRQTSSYKTGYHHLG